MTTPANEVNLTTAGIFTYPCLSEYYANLSPFIAICLFISSLLTVLNIAVFGTTLAKFRKTLSTSLYGLTAAIATLYPIISLAAYITILAPRTWLACNTVMHLCFIVGAILFHRLCFRYVGSETSYLKETHDDTKMVIKTPPCCCCCMCLPTIAPSKTKLGILRYMIWQMPLIQGSILLVLNVICYEDEQLYANVLLYFAPFIVCSILLGLWALNITVRMVGAVHMDYALRKKILCLQLILLLCKLQYLILTSQLDAVQMGSAYPMNHIVYKQAIINVLILAEMFLVSLLVRNAYKIPAEQKPTSTDVAVPHAMSIYI